MFWVHCVAVIYRAIINLIYLLLAWIRLDRGSIYTVLLYTTQKKVHNKKNIFDDDKKKITQKVVKPVWF